ncbi:SMI1/KNR4 family protein [Ornithinimicrobium pekingense]|uniref:Knr4/Smi1-like domain-containing protein n=1 Tax=Ornithinimicrobium pekingense TaxID=384677 RepID=A0ABQ2FE16_9MICO|nr:SMI1/KNR4 family protein [Ornithinimicrobium pekingense]GGK83944.1 hypothetical protein GCM10011509_35560 [Ornithinimicrobium pekingense]
MDYGELVRQLDGCAAALERFGLDVKDKKVHAPATETEVAAVELQLGFTLPDSLRTAFLTITRQVEWSWWVPDGADLPAPFDDIFCGSTWFRLDHLPLLNEHRQQAVDIIFPDPGDAAGQPWRETLPICAVGNGDYLAVDLHPERAGEVIYLEAHGLTDAGNGYRMASSLTDLLERWSPLGQPGPEFCQWHIFSNPTDGMIDPHGEHAVRWKAMIGLP